MVYGREIDGKTLNFEASGALERASLVMRDRETDSWWSIMSSDAIGGPLVGRDLPELAAGEKVQWRDWVARHPDTRVLSVGGREHVENNPYDHYFDSDGTFRGVHVDDGRLAPKAPVYVWWTEGKPVAIAHSQVEGGAIIDDPVSGETLFFHRDRGAHVFSSTEAWRVAGAAELTVDELVAMLEAGETQHWIRMDGFDTYWYTWVNVNDDTLLVE